MVVLSTHFSCTLIGLVYTYAGQEGYAFDVIGLWEHIYRLSGNQVVASTGAKRGDITSQGTGIAGDIADMARC